MKYFLTEILPVNKTITGEVIFYPSLSLKSIRHYP